MLVLWNSKNVLLSLTLIQDISQVSKVLELVEGRSFVANGSENNVPEFFLNSLMARQQEESRSNQTGHCLDSRDNDAGSAIS